MDAEPQTTLGLHTRDPTVLLVGEVAETCRRWLPGWSVTRANDGETACTVTGSDVDAIVIPRRCPDTSGEALLSELRDRGVDAPAAVVLSPDDDVGALELGFDDRIYRPLTEQKVEQMLGRLVRRRAYNRLLRQYYRLVTQRVDANEPPDVMQNDQELDRLVEQVQSVRDELSIMDAQMTPDEYENLFRDLCRFVDERDRTNEE